MIIIKKMRIWKGLSQAELAEELEVSRNYISELERGQKTLSIDLLLKLAVFFDFHPCIFICSRIDKIYPVCNSCKAKILKGINKEISDEEFNEIMESIMLYRKLFQKSKEGDVNAIQHNLQTKR